MNFDVRTRLAVCELLEQAADACTVIGLRLTDLSRRVARSRDKQDRFAIAQARIRQQLDRRTRVSIKHGGRYVRVR